MNLSRIICLQEFKTTMMNGQTDLKAICNRYTELCKLYKEKDILYGEEFTASAKYLAMKCTSTEVADILIEYNILHLSLQCIHTISQHNLIQEKGEVDERESLHGFEFSNDYISFIAILCSNFTSCGLKNVQYFWLNFYEYFEELFVSTAKTNKRRALAACFAIIYNSIRHNTDEVSDTMPYYKRIHDLLTNRSLCCQILLNSIPSLHIKESNEQQGSISTNKADKADPVEEWFYLFVYQIIFQNQLGNLFKLVGYSGTTQCSFSHEQLILLTVAEQVFEDTSLHSVLQEALFPNYNSSTTIKVSNITTTDTTNDLFTHSIVNDIVKNLLSIKYTSNISYLDIHEKDNFVCTIMTVFRLLGTILSFADTYIYLRTELIHVVQHNITLMQICNTILSLVKPKMNNITDSQQTNLPLLDSILGISNEELGEFLKIILCFLCNLIHNCSDAQNALLESGCLSNIFGYCATDFKNPLAREWALLTVRNACDNNVNIQEFVRSLQPQQILQDEALTKQGINVEIDPNTGRFKFHQTANHSI